MKARDVFGGLRLPMAVPSIGDATNRTRAIGDPGLAIVASFLTSVLAAEVGEASAALWPGFPELQGDPDLGAGMPPVRRVHLYQPRVDRPFIPGDFPGLFVFRYAEKTTATPFASDTYRITVPIVVWWVTARTDSEREKYLDPFLMAMGKAISGALSYGYHRAWVIPADLEQPGSLLTITPSLSDQVISSATINGPLSVDPMKPARPVMVQTVVAPGAYTPGKVITVTGIDGRNMPWSDTVTITNPNGGESLITTWRFRQVQSVAVPAMPSTAGSIPVGWAASSESVSGSRFMRAAGLSNCLARHAGDVKSITLKVGDPPQMLTYRAFEMILDTPEDFDPTPTLHAATVNGMDGTYLLPNGEIFAHDNF